MVFDGSISKVALISIIAIVGIIAFALIITTAVLLGIRASGKGPNKTYDCSLALPNTTPTCGPPNISTLTPGLRNTGFLTTKVVIPTISQTTPVMTVTPSTSASVTGYYYGHPTAFYRSVPYGILLSYPFMSSFVYPTGAKPIFYLLGYSYNSEPQQTSSTPYPQYEYETPSIPTTDSLPVNSSAYKMNIENILNSNVFTPDFGSYTGLPTLTSTLACNGSTGVAGSDIKITFNQGEPYIQLTATPQTYEQIVLSSQYSSIETGVLPVGVNGNVTITCTYWLLIQDAPTVTNPRCLVWFALNTTNVDVDTSTPEIAKLKFLYNSPTLSGGTVYITIMRKAGLLINSILQLVASSLTPHNVVLSDIISARDQNTTMQYTIVPTNGMPRITNSTTLWIPPVTCISIGNLSGISLPSPDYFDFPLGTGLVSTQPSPPDNTNVLFFTIWPKTLDTTLDFNAYFVPYNMSNVTDDNPVCNSGAEMYELALTMRVMYTTPTAQSKVTNDMISNCVSKWWSYTSSIGFGSNDKTPFTTVSLDTEVGFISRLSYILATYIQLIACSRNWGSSSERRIVEESTDIITSIVQAGFNTGVNTLFRTLGFVDIYSMMVPNIKTTDVSGGALKSTLYSRLGETLTFLWACEFLVSRGLVPGSVNLSPLLRTLIPVISSATLTQIRSDCSAWRSQKGFFPSLPLNGLLTNSSVGFARDNYPLNGNSNSPDGVLSQCFEPFTPVTHYILSPTFTPYNVGVDKILYCSLPVTQFNPALTYYFGSQIDDPNVTFFLYLFAPGDRSSMLLNSKVDTDLIPFVSAVKPRHVTTALFMNSVKLISPSNYSFT